MDRELERGLQQWLLSRNPEPFDGLDKRARRVYRRLVRRSLIGAIRVSLPLTHRLLEGDQFTELVARWIEESPPTTRLYWRLPLEFSEWIRTSKIDDLPHPAVADLVHWEAVKIDVRNARADGEEMELFDEPVPTSNAILDPSARLGIYRYPVYRMKRDAPSWPEPLPTPHFIVAYRRDEKPRWRRLSAMMAQLLAQLVEDQTIADGLAFLRQMYGDVDEESIRENLRTLQVVGVLRGFSR